MGRSGSEVNVAAGPSGEVTLVIAEIKIYDLLFLHFSEWDVTLGINEFTLRV